MEDRHRYQGIRYFNHKGFCGDVLQNYIHPALAYLTTTVILYLELRELG